MNNTKEITITPGIWRGDESTGSLRAYVNGTSTREVCQVSGTQSISRKEAIKNLYAIEALPKMLEYIRKKESEYSNYYENGVLKKEEHQEWNELKNILDIVNKPIK